MHYSFEFRAPAPVKMISSESFRGHKKFKKGSFVCDPLSIFPKLPFCEDSDARTTHGESYGSVENKGPFSG